MRQILILFFILVAAASFLSSKNSEIVPLELPPGRETAGISPHYPVEIETFDSKKEHTYIRFDRMPERVLVYGVNTVETLLLFEQGAKIVAVTMKPTTEAYAELKGKYPEEFAKIQHITQQELGREQAVAYHPDFILGWKSTFLPVRYGNTEWWRARGINTYIIATSNHVVPHGTIEDECQFLEDMGRIFDVREKAEKVIREIHTELEYAAHDTVHGEAQNVMVVELTGNRIANYDDGWLIGDMVNRLGGQMPVKSRTVGPEDLIAADPDVIFVVYFNLAQMDKSTAFFKEPRFSSLRAVQNGRVYMLPFAYMYATAVKTAEGLRIVKRGLYPERYGAVNE
ncbi:hypothetical protein HMPREF9161_01112 [Selenomonas sp. F0473]|nr:hypothetical protein HMPREF9161_01112 [Selenomonas sp. F0473]